MYAPKQPINTGFSSTNQNINAFSGMQFNSSANQNPNPNMGGFNNAFTNSNFYFFLIQL